MGKESFLLGDGCYNCSDCGKCCHNWLVEVDENEQTIINNLKWNTEDQVPDKVLQELGGRTYLAHKESGACAFFDEDKGHCKIHAKFKGSLKPLGCKLYPFQIQKTVSEQYSVGLRYDCPEVVSNQGKPLTEYKKELTKLAPQLNVHSPKDSQKNELSNDSISDILHLFATMYKQENDLGFEKIAAGIIAAGRLPLLGDTFINDLSMREIIPSYLERAVDDIKTTKIRRMGAFEEARFMAFLSMLIRNDEVAIKGKSVSNRVSRVGIISKFIFGRANLHHFDPQFPDANVGRSELFKTDVTYMDSCWPVLHRFLAMRIQTHQFFGPHYQGLRFFEGLQYLHLIAVSTIALAKWHALALGRITVTEEQIKKSLAWCDHNYGKSQLLKTKPAVILARQCMDIDNNMRQLNGILAFRLT